MDHLALPEMTSMEEQVIFGPQDRYLKRVQQETDTQIVIRDHAMVITGAPSQVDKLARMYQVLLKLVRQERKARREVKMPRARGRRVPNKRVVVVRRAPLQPLLQRRRSARIKM